MTCTGDWSTHHDACDCREAARADLPRTLARLRDSVGDGSIDDHHVRFFVGDVRVVVERLDACERVVEAARALTDADIGAIRGRLRAIDDALAALDGKGETFCACGRVFSECDGSRAECASTEPPR